jgi:polyisoprenoid-binding protein YceI
MNGKLSRPLLFSVPLLAILAAVSGRRSSEAQSGHAQSRPHRSAITIHVGKAGFFSAFGHNHVISAPLAQVAIDPKSRTAAISVRSADMKVMDADVSEKDRTEIQATMLGPKVLDAQKFPEIKFTSSRIEETAPDHFRVSGALQLHGVSRQLAFPVTGTPEHYTGRTKLKQTDFGIQPVSVAGGTVKVKDEIEIEFDVYPEAEPHAPAR